MRVLMKRMENALDLALPSYMSEGAAGMDLVANVSEDITINSGSFRMIPTGIAISVPMGYEAQIRPRSGLAMKYGISLVNTPGTVDSDYRGEINVIMINFGDHPFVVHRGDRIAQMVFNRIENVEIFEVDELDPTARGTGGFGSTGI